MPSEIPGNVVGCLGFDCPWAAEPNRVGDVMLTDRRIMTLLLRLALRYPAGFLVYRPRSKA